MFLADISEVTKRKPDAKGESSNLLGYAPEAFGSRQKVGAELDKKKPDRYWTCQSQRNRRIHLTRAFVKHFAKAHTDETMPGKPSQILNAQETTGGKLRKV